MSMAYTSPTICFTLSGNSCVYSLAVVSAFACPRCFQAIQVQSAASEEIGLYGAARICRSHLAAVGCSSVAIDHVLAES